MISLKYSIHRALSLKKTTAARIINEIEKASFIGVKQGNKTTVNGVSINDLEQQILSSYQRINQLISNYIELKSAILSSNAGVDDTMSVRRMAVCDKRYTMAELIFVSDEVYGNKKYPYAFKQKLLNAMESSYISAVNTVDKQHNKIEDNIREYLSKAVASDKGMTTEEIQKRSEMFHRDGDYTLIDPLKLKSLIDELKQEIETFRTEADAAISENNALITINVNLTTI